MAKLRRSLAPAPGPPTPACHQLEMIAVRTYRVFPCAQSYIGPLRGKVSVLRVSECFHYARTLLLSNVGKGRYRGGGKTPESQPYRIMQALHLCYLSSIFKPPSSNLFSERLEVISSSLAHVATPLHRRQKSTIPNTMQLIKSKHCWKFWEWVV